MSDRELECRCSPVVKFRVSSSTNSSASSSASFNQVRQSKPNFSGRRARLITDKLAAGTRRPSDKEAQSGSRWPGQNDATIDRQPLLKESGQSYMSLASSCVLFVQMFARRPHQLGRCIYDKSWNETKTGLTSDSLPLLERWPLAKSGKKPSPELPVCGCGCDGAPAEPLTAQLMQLTAE